MKRHLIVNRNGHFSALPSAQEFLENAYFTAPDRFLVFEVECDAQTMEAIWLKRDSLIIIGPGLPLTHEEQISDPTHVYAKVVMPFAVNGLATVSLVDVQDGVKLVFAKSVRSAQVNSLIEQMRKGRFGSNVLGESRWFGSNALGEPRWFSANDYSLFAMGVAGLYPSAPSISAPFEMYELTARQAKAVAKDCLAYQQSLNVLLVSALKGIEQAATIEELSAINLSVS